MVQVYFNLIFFFLFLFLPPFILASNLDTTGSCRLLDSASCTSAGGVSTSSLTCGSGCLGACCRPGLPSCANATTSACSTAGGNWTFNSDCQSAGIVCPYLPSGRCCLATG